MSPRHPGNHPGDDSDSRIPLDRVPGYPRAHLPPLPPPPPVPKSHGPLYSWLSNWTPGSIVNALILLVGVLGGAKGVSEIMGSSAATQAKIEASETRLSAKFDERMKLEVMERDKLAVRLSVVERQTIWNAGFAAALNQGKPHPSTPTDAFGAKVKAAGTAHSLPRVETDTPFPAP